MEGGVRLCLLPTVSVGFLELVTEQWPRLQRNANAAVCNVSFGEVVPVDRGLLLTTILCSYTDWAQWERPMLLSLQIQPSPQSNVPALP